MAGAARLSPVPGDKTSPGIGPTHPRPDLDALLAHGAHFSIDAALACVENGEFAAVRDSIEISAPMLSKRVALLEKAGCVHVDEGRVVC